MKIIEEEKRKIIYLDENEQILVKTLFKNKAGIEIKCINHALLIDDLLIKDLENIKMEQNELEKLKEYNQKNHL